MSRAVGRESLEIPKFGRKSLEQIFRSLVKSYRSGTWECSQRICLASSNFNSKVSYNLGEN